MTNWRPDTCGCEFEVAKDWRSAEVLFVCEHHSAERFNAWPDVWTENAFKNMAHTRLVERLPDMPPDAVQFKYDETGALVMLVPDETAKADKAAIETDMAEHFTGDVTIEYYASVKSAVAADSLKTA